MHREELLTEIESLGREAGWTANEVARVRGAWGRKASVEQLAEVRDRLWDATASTHVIWDEEAVHVPVVAAVADDASWLVDAFVWSLPLANCPVVKPTKSEVRAATSAAGFGFEKAQKTLAEWAADKALARLRWMGRKAVA